MRHAVSALTCTSTCRGSQQFIRLVLLAFVTLASLSWFSTREVAAQSGTPPPASKSFYMFTTDPSAAYQLGFNQATALGAFPFGLVTVLAFGRPDFQGGQHGSRLFNNTFAPISAIETAAKQYINGYFVGGGGNPLYDIRLGIGTSNCRPGCADPPCLAGTNVNFNHGQAWGQMVDRVRQWILSTGFGFFSDATGAIDIEGCWNSPANTRSWINGYNTAPISYLYNFGSCDGCPWIAIPGCTTSTFGGGQPNGWTLEDLWWVSWGAAASLPLPQIYRTDCVNAAQWQNVSLHGVNVHQDRMTFDGAFTQFANSNMSSATNTPAEGWQDLFIAIESRPETSQGGFLRTSTDIQ